MGIAVKICGLTTPDAADATLRAKAEFGGLVFFPPSPRNLDLEKGRALAAILRGRTRIVALMVDPDDLALVDVIKAVSPDFIQLHGQETPARVAHIAATFRRPIIKAVPVAEPSDLARARDYEDIVAFLMFDAKAPEGATRPGGLGASFDWKILSASNLKRPWFLAGGLNPENVGRAVKASGAELVDASSGLETAPGRKDPQKIYDFADAARNALYTDNKARA